LESVRAVDKLDTDAIVILYGPFLPIHTRRIRLHFSRSQPGRSPYSVKLSEAATAAPFGISSGLVRPDIVWLIDILNG
jgi:hypothetical protein